MSNPKFATWRPRIGLVCATLGLLLLVAALLPYLRYASVPSNLHSQEMLQHTRALNVLWCASFYGSVVLFFTVWIRLGSLGRISRQFWGISLCPDDIRRDVWTLRMSVTWRKLISQPQGTRFEIFRSALDSRIRRPVGGQLRALPELARSRFPAGMTTRKTPSF